MVETKLDASKSLYRKWLEITISIHEKKWLALGFQVDLVHKLLSWQVSLDLPNSGCNHHQDDMSFFKNWGENPMDLPYKPLYIP